DRPAMPAPAIAVASSAGSHPRRRSPSFGERTLISDSTGMTPAPWRARMLPARPRLISRCRRDRVRGLGELRELPGGRSGVDGLLRHGDAALRALGGAGHVEREPVVQDDEVAPRALVAALEDVADDARVECRIAPADVVERRTLEAEVLGHDLVAL